MNPIKMPLPEDVARKIAEEIFRHFPVGLEVYCCGQDSSGTVIGHHHPEGIVVNHGAGLGITCYSYNTLLSGGLIIPQHGGYFHQYYARQKELQEEFSQFLKSINPHEAEP